MSRRKHWAQTPVELESVRACRAITHQRAANFAFGLRLSPEPKRSALYALYAWTRLADDLADEPDTIEARAARLDAFAERTSGALDGSTPRGATGEPPIWPAFVGAVRSYGLEHDLFEELLLGLRSDLAGVTMRDEPELERYCYRVASTVGLMCVGVWGLRAGADPAEARRLAALRGRAFQLTNILRDFAEDHDAEPRRVYLPEDALERSDLDAGALRAWSEPVRCEAFVAKRVEMARRAYIESEHLDKMVSLDGRPVLAALTGVYRALLERLGASPRRVGCGPSVRVPKPVKLWIATKAIGRAGVARLSGAPR